MKTKTAHKQIILLSTRNTVVCCVYAVRDGFMQNTRSIIAKNSTITDSLSTVTKCVGVRVQPPDKKCSNFITICAVRAQVASVMFSPSRQRKPFACNLFSVRLISKQP